jgi:hypothetical protein
MRDSSVISPKPLRTVCVLMAIFGVMANGQSSAFRLVPGLGLATPKLQPGTLMQETPATPPAAKLNAWQGGLHIEILQGDRGVNIIKKKTAVTPVVEVKDRNNLPVAGVLVLFTSPSDGPSATFLNGERSFSVLSDANGQASASGLKPLNEGSFQIKVSASYQAEVATATIAMTNYLTAAAVPGGTGAVAATGISHMTILILVGVAAAAAVGVGVGLSGHGSGSSAAASTTATIGVGSGASVGAPH